MPEVFDLKAIEKRMDGAIASLKTEFSGLRTGRASIHLLDTITVMAYGTPTPINQDSPAGLTVLTQSCSPSSTTATSTRACMKARHRRAKECAWASAAPACASSDSWNQVGM